MTASDRFGGLSRRTAVIIIATIIVGLLHHTDHVLRVDHSGWPFLRDVSPFTFSLIAYPILLFALLGPARLFWLRWFFLLIGVASALWAHTMLETPNMQYAMWAYDHSLEPQHANDHNLLGLRSPILGIMAAGLGLTLDILLVVAVFSMLIDGLGRRARSLLPT